MKRARHRSLVALVLGLVFLQALAIVTSVHSVIHGRTTPGTIGWVVALNTIPAVAVPVYWMVADQRFEDHLSGGNEDGQLDPIAERLLSRTDAFRVGDTWQVAAVEAAENLAALPVLSANDVSLLVDGQETFDSLFQGIDSARDYILMQWFIVRDDQIGRRVQQALIDKARGGVAVYFLYDGFGSADTPETYFDALREAGVNVAAFQAITGFLARFQFNFRNHRKVTVVDGKVAWIGGHNLGDEYLGRHEVLTPWADAHVRIEGPAALVAQLAFVADWRFMSGEILPLNWEPAPADSGDQEALIVTSGPADQLETAKLVYLHAINSAKKRIWIASPYYVPDQAIISALQLAGLRGVDVRILIPELSDHLIVDLAAHSFFLEAGLTGAKFYMYQEGFLHRKAMLIDDVAAAVGSANFDNRSFRLNFEIIGLFMSPEMIEDVERMFERDFEKSQRIDSDVLESKPFWFRVAAHASRLVAPLL